MIYVSAVYADEGNTLVTGTDADGRTETVPVTHELFRQPADGPVGFTRKKSEGGMGGTIGPYVAPPVVITPPQPSLFAAVAINITDGAISTIEQAAQFGMVVYEDGWLMATFAGVGESTSYLVFAQTDIPARIEQYRSEGGFELVFSDPTSGDPINPNRIDIQILKVR